MDPGQVQHFVRAGCHLIYVQIKLADRPCDCQRTSIGVGDMRCKHNLHAFRRAAGHGLRPAATYRGRVIRLIWRRVPNQKSVCKCGRVETAWNRKGAVRFGSSQAGTLLCVIIGWRLSAAGYERRATKERDGDRAPTNESGSHMINCSKVCLPRNNLAAFRLAANQNRCSEPGVGDNSGA
jgi:hypothetical protein